MADDLTFDPPLEEIEDDAWLPAVTAMAERNGWHEALGEHHHALHVDAAPKLIVTFEHMDDVQETAPGAEPAGLILARETGRSILTILSERGGFFRDEAIYDLFDRLVDEDFFEEFDEVLFYGAGPACGYAACAYSVAAPGARVLALSPMATGDSEISGWDDRYPEAWRLDFGTRYGFAPEMIDAAAGVTVIFDPLTAPNAMHAALFVRPNVTRLRMRRFGRTLDVPLQRMGIWTDVILGAADGTLDRLAFAKLLRARRDDFHFVRALVANLAQTKQVKREGLVLRAVEDRLSSKWFRRRAGIVQNTLEAEDDALPPRRTEADSEGDAAEAS